MYLVIHENKLIGAYEGMACITGNAPVEIREVKTINGRLNIPKDITGIGTHALKAVKVDTVVIPLNVRSIDKDALCGVKTLVFSRRNNVKRLHLAEGWCNGVRRVLIGDTAVTLALRVFDRIVTA